jgi:hypothetical protein
MRKLLIVLLLAGLALTCAACNLPQKGAGTLPAPAQATSPVRTAAVTPPSGQPGGQPTAAGNATPAADPSAVVQAFLIAYPDDTLGMENCLSSTLKAALPAGGPGMLLQVEGDVNGFVISSGSEVPNPPQAVVMVDMVAGNSRLTRTFNLVKENDRWVINSITP